jgi:hypothetical protein
VTSKKEYHLPPKGRYAKIDNPLSVKWIRKWISPELIDTHTDKQGATAIGIHCSKGTATMYILPARIYEFVWSEKKLCPVDAAICFFLSRKLMTTML